MRKNKFVIGVVLGVGLAVAVGSVEAKEKPFHASFVGSCTTKDDLSFTGPPIFHCIVAGKSTWGKYTAQAVVEASPDGATCTLPGGGSGIEYLFAGEVFVLSFAEKEEQLFLSLSPSVTSHGCFDPSTGLFVGKTTFAVSGGSDRFDGATGTIVKTWKALFLAPPASPPGKGGFFSFTGTFDGAIEIAK